MQPTRRQFTQKALLAAAGCTTLAQQLFAQATSTNYIIRNGDTLGQIARHHGVSTAELRHANGLSGDLIGVGQKLSIPRQSAATTVVASAGNPYLVQLGDTLGGIALNHGISVGELKRTNNLSSDVIHIGQTLHIPAIVSTADLLSHVRAETAKINLRRNNWQRIVVHLARSNTAMPKNTTPPIANAACKTASPTIF